MTIGEVCVWGDGMVGGGEVVGVIASECMWLIT